MTSRPRIPTLPPRIQMAQPRAIARAPRIAATLRQRGQKWVDRRKRWLMDHPLCCGCQAEGRVTAGQEVDHVIPLWAGGADEESNYQTLCREHHAAKTAREASERARADLPSKD